jgi:hypothetical protein
LLCTTQHDRITHRPQEDARQKAGSGPVPDVLDDELYDVLQDLVLDCLRHEAEARAARHGQVPGVVILVLILAGERLGEEGHQVGQRVLHVEEALAGLLLHLPTARVLLVLPDLLQDVHLLHKQRPASAHEFPESQRDS